MKYSKNENNEKASGKEKKHTVVKEEKTVSNELRA